MDEYTAWINTEHYDIEAKIEDRLLKEQKKVAFDQWQDEVRLMVMSLLAERFHLKTSYTTKVVPAFALMRNIAVIETLVAKAAE